MRTDDNDVNSDVSRIFILQIVLVLVTTLLVVCSPCFDLGFYWPAFCAGAFGASVALLRKIRKSQSGIETIHQRAWVGTLMPLLYGGIMAGLTYFLFMANILSGDSGGGLLTSNLFPSFKQIEPPVEGAGTMAVSMVDFFNMRPTDMQSVGKLVVWCFLSGYSESFVTGILSRLEKTTGGD